MCTKVQDSFYGVYDVYQRPRFVLNGDGHMK
jgi:hypothetical protein